MIWFIKKIAPCSYSTVRDVRLRFKAGRLRGTLLERQRCKVQGNSNLSHDHAIYLFIQHCITFILLLLVDISIHLRHPCNFYKKAILVLCFQCCWSILLTLKIIRPEKICLFLYILSILSTKHYKDTSKQYIYKILQLNILKHYLNANKLKLIINYWNSFQHL